MWVGSLGASKVEISDFFVNFAVKESVRILNRLQRAVSARRGDAPAVNIFLQENKI